MPPTRPTTSRSPLRRGSALSEDRRKLPLSLAEQLVKRSALGAFVSFAANVRLPRGFSSILRAVKTTPKKYHDLLCGAAYARPHGSKGVIQRLKRSFSGDNCSMFWYRYSEIESMDNIVVV
jgi:hypothetical protein